MINTIEEWISSDEVIDKLELEYLFPSINLLNAQDGRLAKQRFLNRISYNCNLLSTHDLDLDPQGATQLIGKLFSYYANDDTLIVASDLEHPAVKNYLYKYKKQSYIIREFLDILNVNLDTIEDIVNVAKKYKKVLVYVIGMQNAFMTQSPNAFYSHLKARLSSEGIHSIICIDAVQELFLTPRDYSIFDYAIGTAHSTVSNYNLGFLVRRKNLKSFNTLGLDKNLSLFLKQLDILFKRKDKIYSFKKCMTKYFNDTCPFAFRQLNTVDYAFSFELPMCKISYEEYKRFETVLSLKYDIAVAPFQTSVVIRFRAPSIVLGVNFNNDKRSNDNFSLLEGISKTYKLCSMLLER